MIHGNVNYEDRYVDMLKGEHKSDECLKYNPDGTIPFLVVNGKCLKESASLLRFIANAYPGLNYLYPEDFFVRHNVESKDEKGETVKDSFQTFALHDMSNILHAKCINLNSGVDLHQCKQLEGSPFIDKNLAAIAATRLLSNPPDNKHPRGLDLFSFAILL
jgi:hypothetical protein